MEKDNFNSILGEFVFRGSVITYSRLEAERYLEDIGGFTNDEANAYLNLLWKEGRDG